MYDKPGRDTVTRSDKAESVTIRVTDDRGIDMKRNNAFTGIEAAIVLIAFVVVAAVFSYVMLGAGFFATQKAQEVTYASIKQATSNVVFEGMMYGNTTQTGDLIGFTFSVKVPGGGQPIDMSNTEFIFTSTYAVPPIPLKDGNDGKNYAPLPTNADILYPEGGTCVGYDGDAKYKAYFPTSKDSGLNGDPVLQPGQNAFYTVCIGGSDPTEVLKSGDWFSVEMIPQIGAPTLMTKRIDAGLQNGKPLL
jgi:flagellin FlaB